MPQHLFDELTICVKLREVARVAAHDVTGTRCPRALRAVPWVLPEERRATKHNTPIPARPRRRPPYLGFAWVEARAGRPVQ